MIAGLLLAGGASRRFGSNKLVAPLSGRPVVRWSAEALAAAVDVVYVVVPPGSEAVHEALDGVPVRWVENPDAREGLASSIRAGVLALFHRRFEVRGVGENPELEKAHRLLARAVAL